MNRLPVPGGDDGTWGNVLNDFLSVTHNADGTLKDTGVIAAKYVKPSSGIPKADLTASVQASLDNADAAIAGTAPDASAGTKGLVQLAGDLGGTAASPTVPGLAAKANDAAVVHLTGAETVAGIKTFSSAPVVPDGSFTQAKVTNLVSDLSAKEATIAAGTTSQYWRGDKSWQAIDKTTVGLTNVDNTSDANKPVSTATQTALNGKQRTYMFDVRDYGAVPNDSTFDNTAAFRAALTAAKNAGANSVYAPAGTFWFAPITNSIILPLTTGVGVRGAGRGETIFKVKDAANPAVPANWKAFVGSNMFTTDDLTGCELRDFTFDYNTANNPVVDVASLTSGNRTMFMAPKGNRIRIHRVDVINGDGKWVVQMGGTYAAAIQGGYRCDDAFIDIHVENFGLNSAYHDSSAVYIIGDRAKVRGTYRAATTAPGAVCAIEMHGNDYDVQVTVDGWVSVANLTGLDLTGNSGGVVHDCVARNVMLGFVIWSGNGIGATDYGIDGLTIANNVITLNPDRWSGAGKASPPGNFAHAGVALNDMGATVNLPIRNLKIRGNTFRYEPTTETGPKTLDSGIALIRASSMSGTPLPDTDIDISDNTIDSTLAAGVVVDLSNNVNNFTCHGLKVHNPIANGIGTLLSNYASGMYLEGKFFGLSIRGVVVTDSRATPVTVSGVDMSGVSNLSPPTGRQSVSDVTVVFTVTGGSVTPVVGPTGGTGGVFIRVANHGYYAPTGRFAYGSEYVDYGNGHTYRQTTSPAGTSWQVWSEIRPEGVVVGAANVTVAAPTGLVYLPMLDNAGGTPTGPPTTQTGRVPLVVDGAGKLWVYVGGVWQGVATA